MQRATRRRPTQEPRDEVKGHAKEAWGNVKDSANELNHRSAAEENAPTAGDTHSVRESITSAAENAKNSIHSGLDNLDRKTQE